MLIYRDLDLIRAQRWVSRRWGTWGPGPGWASRTGGREHETMQLPQEILEIYFIRCSNLKKYFYGG